MDFTTTIIIALSTLLVSSFNAAIGPTGGVQLAVVATLLPPQLSIPVHAAISGTSSITRALQLRQHIDWPFFRRFTSASCIGILITTILFFNIENGALLCIIGLFILSNNFIPYSSVFGRKSAPLMDAGIGFATGLLTVFVGATGPAVFSYIAAGEKSRHLIVATDAACMSLQHSAKILAFSIIGTQLLDFLWQILLFAVAAIAGTAIGVVLLTGISDRVFRLAAKTGTSMIGLFLLISGIESLLNST